MAFVIFCLSSLQSDTWCESSFGFKWCCPLLAAPLRRPATCQSSLQAITAKTSLPRIRQFTVRQLEVRDQPKWGSVSFHMNTFCIWIVRCSCTSSTLCYDLIVPVGRCSQYIQFLCFIQHVFKMAHIVKTLINIYFFLIKRYMYVWSVVCWFIRVNLYTRPLLPFYTVLWKG